MSRQIICSQCGTSYYTATTRSCPSCGHITQTAELLNETQLVPHDDEDTQPHAHNRRAYFGQNMKLALYIMETDTHLNCELERTLTIGRKIEDQEDHHLDLSKHGATQLGVSRRHVRLTRSTATIMLEDLGTLNGTFLNGEKLTPGQKHVLCDGDELRVGKMIMAVIYERP